MVWNQAACYRIEKRGTPENSWGGCWEECSGNPGCWTECWQGCCEGGFRWKGMRSSTLASTACSTPNFRSTLPSTLPSYFLGFPASLFCSRPPGSQGYGLVAYGMASFQSPKNIFQRPRFPGKCLEFRRKSDFRQISDSEI